MELIRGEHNLRARHQPCVATIGNFDGIHRGHQAVIEALHAAGKRLGLPTTVVIFEPQPREFFTPDRAPGRITQLRDKLRVLASLGVERTVCLRFDRRRAEQSADDFIQSFILDGLGVRFLMVGDDFRFGHRRAGDFARLDAASKAHGFELERMPTLTFGDDRISSTRVRDALERGDLDGANALLGRRLRISGRVVRGEALGRVLGWPTANLRFACQPPPMRGVFNVAVHGLGEVRPGVASLGTRPTVNGVETLLETYLIDFSGNLYGQYIEVELLERQRGEEHFDGLEALKSQIAADVAAARVWFEANDDVVKTNAG
ncbi:MAG: bifunctional riboflavin kinase/FAD synthetase [Spiribacter sp.]|jgi:riboflavin kinase/FMN adenylyltransferase|nr:bifunctional riboflavin kinase/FAD synthetase [Spiribacter sp.]MDR9489059.1 bifunctional riboflavin kinase/FAD synthetase [Spiribacter sp.]